jgi:hypothetical protein
LPLNHAPARQLRASDEAARMSSRRAPGELEARVGGPARGYSWPPFESGNAAARRHGFYAALREEDQAEIGANAEELRSALRTLGAYSEAFEPYIGSLAGALLLRARGLAEVLSKGVGNVAPTLIRDLVWLERRVQTGLEAPAPGREGLDRAVSELGFVPSLGDLDAEARSRVSGEARRTRRLELLARLEADDEYRRACIDAMGVDDLEAASAIVALYGTGFAMESAPGWRMLRLFERAARRLALGVAPAEASGRRRDDPFRGACVAGVAGCRCLASVLDDPRAAALGRRGVLIVARRRHGETLRRCERRV